MPSNRSFPRLFAVVSVLSTIVITPTLEAHDFVVRVVRDLFLEFPRAKVRDSLSYSSSSHETSNGVRRAGIFLHPKHSTRDAEARFDEIELPDATPSVQPFLVFFVGFRDNIPWDAEDARPNGVRFSVRIDGETRYSEVVSGVGWRLRVVPLAERAGETVSITLASNAIGGNTSYDWCVFAEPQIVVASGTSDPGKLTDSSPGLAFAEVDCTVPGNVSLRVGDASTTARLAKGRQWLACEFAGAREAELVSEGGVATMRRVSFANHAATLLLERFESPLAYSIVGEDLELALSFRNTGKGRFLGAHAPGVDLVDGGGRVLARATVALADIEPGETQDALVRWRRQSLPPEIDSDGRLSFRCLDQNLDIDVFRERIRHIDGAAPPGATRCRVIKGSDDRHATLENTWTRITFAADARGRVRARTERRSGKSLHASATLFPLAELSLDTSAGEGQSSSIRLRRFEKLGESRLRLVGEIAPAGSPPWRATIDFEIAPDHPRVHVRYEAEAPQDSRLRLLRTLRCLVGGRHGDATRDFAIFPGLEYLEGAEGSSSTRDLAYPLSERRVPAPYKIATPLMALSRGDDLIGTLWNQRQSWMEGHEGLAARFDAPPPEATRRRTLLELSIPAVGDSRAEHSDGATAPITVRKGRKISVDAFLLIDSRARHPAGRPARSTRPGAFILEVFQQHIAEFGLPEPSPSPRPWSDEKALSRHAYFNVLWSEDPAGFAHCHNWAKGLQTGHCVPLLLDARDNADAVTRAEIERRVRKIVKRSLGERGPGSLWSGAGCHILLGELPFLEGQLGPSLAAFRDHARRVLARRQDNKWVWHPSSRKHRSLGTPGAHTSGQAARPALETLRAARLSGDPELARTALDALRQLEGYQVPRGAQTWECPVMQPDILTSAYAVRAYCEAYRLTGDSEHLAQARYWAMTGLPFIYTWSYDDYPTMRYNTIAVIGSTFHTHSWIGLPVVWCGLAYAYALQDLATWDSTLDWRKIAQGITRSAMWQQYTDGPSRGCYPDSWHMVENEPRPADINPENILVNEFRLRGLFPGIEHARLQLAGRVVHINSGATKLHATSDTNGSTLSISVEGKKGFSFYSIIAAGSEPREVTRGQGSAISLPRVTTAEELRKARDAWRFEPALRAVIVKTTSTGKPEPYSLSF